jgi:hypothetical protein
MPEMFGREEHSTWCRVHAKNQYSINIELLVHCDFSNNFVNDVGYA